MSEELKPCPFCGGEARECLTHLPAGWFDSIECTKCGASTDGYPPPNDAIAAWNTRAALATPQPAEAWGMVEALPAVPVTLVAGRSAEEWQNFARQDDCLGNMVPSDLRQIVGAWLSALRANGAEREEGK